MDTDSQIEIHERLATLEQQVETIMTNHLPHIQASVNDLSTKFWAVIILLIANLVAVLVNFVK
jgi:Holliday junction resolvasome RuvABC endonuclease subunit